MPQTVNDLLLHSDIGHSIDLAHYSNGVVARIIAILNRTDSSLFAQLTQALENMDADSFTVQRLDMLLQAVRELNAQAYEQVGKELTDELKNLSDYEAGYQQQLFNSTIPPQVIADVRIVGISAEQAYAAAMARPFQGRLLKEWAKSIESDRMTRIRDTVRMGFLENQTTSQIIQRVRGTKKNKYADGIIEIDRHHAEAIVRTAVSHTASTVRNRFFEANSDLIKAIVWTATLDSRTSEICRIRDLKQYQASEPHKPIGHNIPWLQGPGLSHWACRSVATPVTKSWKELSGVDVESFSPQTRASMDGALPADTSYAEWIRKQSAARQDEILGPTRGKLMREGGLGFDKFYNEKGKFLNLSDLRERDAKAFSKAGLN